MKISKGIVCTLMPALFAFSTQPLLAQDAGGDPASSGTFSLDDHFHTGRREASFGVGTLFSPMIVTANRPTVDYSFAYGQLGFMVTDLAGKGPLRGNLELAPEFFGAGIYENTGHYIVGGTLWIRYNFVQKGWRLVPYLQAGGGSVYTDMSHRYDGMNYNFNVDAAAGLRYFVSRRCSLDLEYRFQHISNADLGRHNLGTNAQGPVLGLSWVF